MNLKEKFENHVVIFGSVLVITGFAAGFAVAQYLPVKIANGNQVVAQNVEKEVHFLINEHNKRKSELLAKYQTFETEATSFGNITEVQKKYAEAAGRIKDLLKQEDEALQSHLDKLQPKLISK